MRPKFHIEQLELYQETSVHGPRSEVVAIRTVHTAMISDQYSPVRPLHWVIKMLLLKVV